MRFLISFLVCCLFMGACGKRKEKAVEIPRGILPPDSLENLLFDFALSESASNLNIKGAPITKFDSAYAFDPLTEHHISKNTYDSSLLFYAHHQLLYKHVYDSLLVKLGEYRLKKTIKIPPVLRAK